MKLIILTGRHSHWRKSQAMISDLIEAGYEVEERDAMQFNGKFSTIPAIFVEHEGIRFHRIDIRDPKDVDADKLIGGALDWVPGGLNTPQATEGWLGLLGLSILYGIAFTLLFVLAPRLDMGRNSPVLNFEPVASLFLGFVFLGQFLLPMQLIGGAMVIAGILAIGFKGQ